MILSASFQIINYVETRACITPFDEQKEVNPIIGKHWIRVYQNKIAICFLSLFKKLAVIETHQGRIHFNKKSLVRWLNWQSTKYQLPEDWDQKSYQEKLACLCRLQMDKKRNQGILIDSNLSVAQKNFPNIYVVFPNEIFFNIFQFLDLKYLARAALVCKKFHELTNGFCEGVFEARYPFCQDSALKTISWISALRIELGWDKPPTLIVMKNVWGFAQGKYLYTLQKKVAKSAKKRAILTAWDEKTNKVVRQLELNLDHYIRDNNSSFIMKGNLNRDANDLGLVLTPYQNNQPLKSINEQGVEQQLFYQWVMNGSASEMKSFTEIEKKPPDISWVTSLASPASLLAMTLNEFEWFIVAFTDGTIELWNEAEKKLQFSVKAEVDKTNKIVNPFKEIKMFDGRLLMARTNHSIFIWNIPTLQQIFKKDYSTCAVMFDDRRVVIAQSDKIHIFDLASNKHILTLNQADYHEIPKPFKFSSDTFSATGTISNYQLTCLNRQKDELYLFRFDP